jgi:hypothetical protein
MLNRLGMFVIFAGFCSSSGVGADRFTSLPAAVASGDIAVNTARNRISRPRSATT